MSTCTKCEQGFVPSDVIAVCNVCNDLFHASSTGKNCSGCSASEIKILDFKKKKPLMVYRYSVCTSNGGEDASLKELVADLQKTINELSSFKEQVQGIKDSIPDLQYDIGALKVGSENHAEKIASTEDAIVENRASADSCIAKINKVENTVKEAQTPSDAAVDKADFSDLFQGLMSELDNRRYRENNLLLLNVPDGSDMNSELDAVTVSNILCNIKNLKTKFSKTNVFRLGVYDANKCRPILVKMINHVEVTTVLVHWKLLKDGVRVSADLTKCQRVAFNNLKQKAAVFNGAQTSDSVKQIVKFVHGNPKIITIDNKHHDRPNKGRKSSISTLNKQSKN